MPLRILYVSAEAPWPLTSGGKIVSNALYCRGLPSLGVAVHGLFPEPEAPDEGRRALEGQLEAVTFIPQGPGRARHTVRAASTYVTGGTYASGLFLPPGASRFVREVSARTEFDVLVLEHQHAYPAVPSTLALPIVAHFHNVNSTLYARTAVTAQGWLKRVHSRLQRPRALREESALLRRSAVSIAPSEEDAALLRSIAPGASVAVVPYGIETAALVPPAAPDRLDATSPKQDVLFLGKMDYHPNVEGALYLVRSVMPLVWKTRPDARVAIVGHSPAREVLALANDARVVVTGGVPDVRPYLHGARVMTVPLKSGSGVRIKAMEAAAASKAIVGTSQGLEGLPFVHGQSALVADDAATFAACVLDVLRDEDLTSRLGTAARRLAESVFDWSASSHKLYEVLDRARSAARAT